MRTLTLRGEGHEKHRLPHSDFTGAVAMSDEGLTYFISGKLFVLSEIADAGDELAQAVMDCTESVIL